MSKENKPRKPKQRPQLEIQKEYDQVCSAIGDREYKRRVMAMEMDKLCERAFALNAEVAKQTEAK